MYSYTWTNPRHCALSAFPSCRVNGPFCKYLIWNALSRLGIQGLPCIWVLHEAFRLNAWHPHYGFGCDRTEHGSPFLYCLDIYRTSHRQCWQWWQNGRWVEHCNIEFVCNIRSVRLCRLHGVTDFWLFVCSVRDAFVYVCDLRAMSKDVQIYIIWTSQFYSWNKRHTAHTNNHGIVISIIL